MIDLKTTSLTLYGEDNREIVIHGIDEVQAAESRLEDLRRANKSSAPELLSALNNGYLAASRIISHLKFEYTRIARAANKRKAIVMLDVAPTVLKEKNLITARSPAGNEDMRNSVLNCDDEYLEILEKADYIKMAIMLFEGKQEAINNALIAVRRIMDPRGDYTPSYGNVIPENAEAGKEIDGFGRSRY